MNKIVASFGIVALGASAIQSTSAQGFGPEHSKPWAVSATLRGFYDDNINGAPSGTNKVDSFGFEVSPGIGLDWQSGPTSVKLGYRYSLRYYDEERFKNFLTSDGKRVSSGHDSHTHSFDAAVDHAFSERYSVSLRDSFVVGQEPDVLRAKEGGGSSLTPVPGDNIRNYGAIAFTAVLTPVFDLEVGYDNQWFDYDDSGANGSGPGFIASSLSGVLDRIEQTVHVEGLWRFLPTTQLILGYQYGMINFTGDEQIGPDGSNFRDSSDRDNRSHYIYTGLNHTFSPDLSGSVRVGGRFTEYYNAANDQTTDVNPYARASLRYSYAMESYLEAGASYDLSMAPYADVRNAETANLFASVRHRIVPKLFANLTGQVQDLKYKGGSRNGDNDWVYTAGLNLEYAILPYLSTHIGYNFDAVQSDLPNSDYQRNRVYIGLTATY